MKSINIASALFALGGSAFAQQAPDCPNAGPDLTQLQSRVADQLNNDATPLDILHKLDGCYGSRDKVPACLQRAYGAAENRLAQRTEGGPLPIDNEIDMRRPPDELMATKPGSDEKLMQLFQTTPAYKDAEQIAKENGWPSVRYKSRHSGGFDPGTPSLLMIYVPGKKMTPPVDYDRYINIALPADPSDLNPTSSGGDPTVATDGLDTTPKAKVPSPDDYASGQSMPRTTTIMTVKQGAPGQPSRVLFSKYHRVGQQWEGEKFNPITDCISCHPNGMRAISPFGYNVNPHQAEGHQVMSDDDWAAVRTINGSMDTIQNHGAADWGTFKDADGKVRPLLNQHGLGPLYGPTKPLKRNVVTGSDGKKKLQFPTREKKYIVGDDGHSGCAFSQTSYNLQDIFRRAEGRSNHYTLTQNPPVDWQKVSKRMDCAQCHDGSTHGGLTASTSFDTIAYKILVDQSMPLWDHTNPGDTSSHGHPGHVTDDLNSNERIALVNCLQQEFSDSESADPKAWLKQDTCAAPHVANDGATGDGTGAAGATGAGDSAGVHPAE